MRNVGPYVPPSASIRSSKMTLWRSAIGERDHDIPYSLVMRTFGCSLGAGGPISARRSSAMSVADIAAT